MREVILLSFPGIFIPPLSKLKNRGNSSEDTLIKRYKCLNIFMNALILHPLIIHSEQLQLFLKQANDKAFKGYKEHHIIKPFENVGFFPSINGELKGDVIDHSDTALILKEFYKKNAETMKKLKEKAKNIANDLKNITTAILNMAEIVSKLEKIQDALLFTNKYQQIYAGLKNLFEKLIENQKKKINIVNDHLAIFFKYAHLEQESLNSFVLHNEKHLLSFKIEKSKELYAYFNSQNIRETKRVNKQTRQNNYKNFFRFCLGQASLARDLQDLWASLLEEIKV